MKPWWASKTIIGAIATLVGSAIGLDADGSQQLAGELMTLAGAALAIYGRVKATQSVGLKREASDAIGSRDSTR